MAEEIDKPDTIHAEAEPSGWDELKKEPETSPDDEWGWLEDEDEPKTQHETFGEAALEAMADLEVVAEVEDTKEKRTKFGAFELTEEELGADRVLVDHIKKRSKFDIFGIKEDEKNLEKICTCPHDKIGSYLTPTVAQKIVDRFISGDITTMSEPHRATAIFNALPLAEQEKIARSEAAPELLRFLARADGDGAKCTINKMCACMTETLAAPSDEETDEKAKSIGDMISETTGTEAIMMIRNLHAHVSSENRRKMFEAGSRRDSISRFSLGVVLLDRDELMDCVKEIAGNDKEIKRIRVRDMAKLLKYRTNADLFNEPGTYVDEDELDPILGDLSSYRFIQTIKSKNTDIITRYSWAGEDKCKEMLEQISEAEPLFDELSGGDPEKYEQLLKGLLLSQRGDLLVEEALKKGDELDDEIKEHLTVYLTQYRSIDNTYARLINSLEDIRDFAALRLRGIRQLEQDGDVHMAKKELCKYAYHMRLGTLIREFVALGVLKYDGRDRRKTEEWSGTDPEGFYEDGGFKVRLKNLQVFREKAGLSDEEYALLLDAIALAQTPEKSIGKIIEGYEQQHFGDTRKLGEVLLSIRERRRRELSKSFTKTMQESLAASATEVKDANLEYEGTPIKLLRMTGSRFRILVHHLGAYSTKDLDDPSRFDQFKQWHHDEKGKPVGYISTCTLSEGALFVAQVGDLSDGDEVYYGFSDLGEDGFLYEAEYDTYTDVQPSRAKSGDESGETPMEVVTERQDFLYDDMDELIKRTKARKRPFSHDDYNEVVLDRYARNRPEPADELLYPTHVIVFTNDPGKISERVKKHAAYLGVPILMIDPARYRSLI